MPQLKLRGNIGLVFPIKGAAARTFTLEAEVRSIHATKWRSTSTLKLRQAVDDTTGTARVVVHLPFVMKGSTPLDIPLICLIRAVEGVFDWEPMTEDDILRTIFLEGQAPDWAHEGCRGLVRSALRSEPWASWTREQNVAWIEEHGSKASGRDRRYRYVVHILQNEYLPHIPEPRDRLVYLGMLVRRMAACHLGLVPPDDRDHAGNKRLDGPGPLMAILFRQLFRNHLKHIKQSLTRAVEANKAVNIVEFLQPRRIETGLAYHFSTGTWSLNRQTNKASSSPWRACRPAPWWPTCGAAPSARREGKAPLVRQLHPTDWGISAPARRPRARAWASSRTWRCWPTSPSAPRARGARRPSASSWTARRRGPSRSCSTAPRWRRRRRPGQAEALRAARREGRLMFDTSVTWDPYGGVQVFCDGGRICRPVLVGAHLDRLPGVVATTAHMDLWDVLVAEGCIEYVDKREEESMVVAPDIHAYCAAPHKYSSVEIDPSVFLSPTTACIPFSNMNQGPRNMYQASMHKQAISVPQFNYRDRFDVHQYVLCHPTRPLVSTRGRPTRSSARASGRPQPHRRHRLLRGPQPEGGSRAPLVPARVAGRGPLCSPSYARLRDVEPPRSPPRRGTHTFEGGGRARIRNAPTAESTLPHQQKQKKKKHRGNGGSAAHCTVHPTPRRRRPRADPPRLTARLRPGADSIIVSRAAIDRGFARLTAYMTFSADLRVGSMDVETFEVPAADVIGRRAANYGKLGPDGIVPVDTIVEAGDVIVGRVRPHPGQGRRARVRAGPQPVLRKNEGGRVVAVLMTQNKDGMPSLRVKIAQVRVPQVGDKLSSRHGQKGTIGHIMRAEDLPFTSEGITPDIIVNPHAIPSRMTIGHLVECLMAKTCAVRGCRGDGTPFQGTSIDTIARELKRQGYPQHGKEVLYSGVTGQRLEALIFIGPTYYQRLRHMVDDKWHSRGGHGPVTALTRQPLEGRAKDGGLRYGEMEKDATLSHGAAHMLTDKLLNCSDRVEVHICEACGSIGEAPPPQNRKEKGRARARRGGRGPLPALQRRQERAPRGHPLRDEAALPGAAGYARPGRSPTWRPCDVRLTAACAAYVRVAAALSLSPQEGTCGLQSVNQKRRGYILKNTQRLMSNPHKLLRVLVAFESSGRSTQSICGEART